MHTYSARPRFACPRLHACVATQANISVGVSHAVILWTAQDDMHEEHVKRFWAQLGQRDMGSDQLEFTLVQSLQVACCTILFSDHPVLTNC